MLHAKPRAPSYSLMVKNRPGELAKLTKYLSDESIKVNSLLVANIGDTACIRFSMARDCDLRGGLRRAGLRARFQ